MGSLLFELTHGGPFSPDWWYQPGPKGPLVQVGVTNRDKWVTLLSRLVVSTETKDLDPLVPVAATNRD